jgi:FimV-like protein
LGLPNSVQALGLGAPVLNSHLNEILDVRVPLLLAEGESLNSIFIEFAKPNEYRLVGLEPYTNLSSLRVSVEHTQHGGLYIFLSSVSVVQAPIISLLLKARIGHNTYYKQVQLLLDTMESGAGTHVIKARPKSLSPRLNGIISKATPDVEEERGWARTWRYGPVRSGDSLSTIAYRLRRDKQWSNHDIMLALYRFNANAFIEHDMNRLKSGVWLEVPREQMLKELLKQAPAPYENIKRKSPPSSKKLAKPMLEPETAIPEVKTDNVASQLRYVGRIALGNDEPSLPLDGKVSSDKRSVQLQQQLDQLYKQAMDDHLQMASLDQNLTAIRDDIGKLSSDIAALKEQQNAMQQQAQGSPNTSYWMLGFLLLCLLNIILLGAFLYHRYSLKKKEKYDIEEVYFKKEVKEPAPIEEPKSAPATKKVRKKHILENKIFDLENYLNLRDYEAAENILKQLSESELNHIGICALHARFYHETERLDELDALIRNKKSVLNEREWSLLCDRLPINIWHALHESGVIKDNGALLSDKDSLIYDNDDKAAAEVDLLKEEEMARKLQLDATVIMKASDLTPFFEKDRDEAASIQEDSSLSTLTSEVVDMEDNDLELDDIDLETINNGAVEESLREDDFTSTVFTTTGTQKKS